MYGGTSDNVHISGSYNGLSPRVRGNPPPPRPDGGKERSIPACAGEPYERAGCRRAALVYPRVCGGTPCPASSNEWPQGLSPRVRGNPATIGRAPTSARSIPACAGEPCMSPPSRLSGQVYPRVCGGTIARLRSTSASCGLSPRVRGNPGVDDRPACGVRSIPACAGEPPSQVSRRACPKVYPRVCGGTLSHKNWMSHSWGLSPRVRGNRQLQRVGADELGSIPACAGEPPSPCPAPPV